MNINTKTRDIVKRERDRHTERERESNGRIEQENGSRENKQLSHIYQKHHKKFYTRV